VIWVVTVYSKTFVWTLSWWPGENEVQTTGCQKVSGSRAIRFIDTGKSPCILHHLSKATDGEKHNWHLKDDDHDLSWRQGIKHVPAPSDFYIHETKHSTSFRFVGSPPFSMTHTRQLIQFWKTLWTLSKVSSSQILGIPSSIPSLELNTQSFKIPFNILKSQRSHGLMPGE
jgi:hypothetical protein